MSPQKEVFISYLKEKYSDRAEELIQKFNDFHNETPCTK